MSSEPLALIDQLRSRQPRLPATAALVLANGVVFAAMLWAGAGLWHAPNDVQLAWGANFAPATQAGEWWRLASAMFLHFGLLHLAVNLLALVESGRFVERFYGSYRFLALYFFAGLSGNLLSLVVRGSHGISGGASGAIFGVFAGLLWVLWRYKSALHPREYRWLLGAVAGFTAVNFVLGSWIVGIDNAAHLGGWLAGMMAAIMLDPAREGAVARLRPVVAALACLWLGVLIVRLPPPAYDWHDELSARQEIRHFLEIESRIGERWQALRDTKAGERSFEALASRIDAELVQPYAQSFEALSALHLDPRAPSVQVLERLKEYAEMRRDASGALAEALREHDPEAVRRAMEQLHAASQALEK